MAKFYPGSLAARYCQATNKPLDIETVARLVLETPISFDLPSNDSVAIHLRLGDTLEFDAHSVDDHLEASLPYSENPFTGGEIYVRPKSYFDEQLALLRQQGVVFDKVVLVHGRQHATGIPTTRSEEYVSKLIQHLSAEQALKATVKTAYAGTTIPEKADEDFIFLARAPHLIVTGGQFGRVIRLTNEALKRRAPGATQVDPSH